MTHSQTVYLARGDEEIPLLVEYEIEPIRAGRSNCEPGDAEEASGGEVVMFSIWHGDELMPLAGRELDAVLSQVEENHVH